VIAEIDHFLHVGRGKLLDVAVDRVDVHPIEEHLERRAERQAPPTAAADVIDPPQLPVDRGEIPELRTPDIERSHARTVAFSYRTGSRREGSRGRGDRTRSRAGEGGRRAPRWSPAAAEERTRAAWSGNPSRRPALRPER